MLDVVELLPLAESLRPAESLVGLAAHRQVVRADRSVGVPVDLVSISRDRGFAWVRSERGLPRAL